MVQQITQLPDPPSRADPANFAAKGDAFLGALPQFRNELNLAGDDFEAGLAIVEQAIPAAEAAIGAANYKGDYSAGVTYQIGQSVSYIENGIEYVFVAKTINLGVTPVSGANWLKIDKPRTPDLLLINAGII